MMQTYVNSRSSNYPECAEEGSRDGRVAVLALIMWATMLCCHAVVWSASGLQTDAGVSSDVAAASVPAGLLPVVLGCVVAAVLVGLSLCVASGAARRLMAVASRRFDFWQIPVWLTVAACSIGVAAFAQMQADVSLIHDPAVVQSRSGSAEVTAIVRITAPVMAAKSWEADCQADGLLEELGHGGVVERSHVKVRLMMSDEVCGSTENGQTVIVSGSVERAIYGARPVWITVDDGRTVSVVRPPPPARRVINAMQRSFMEVTGGLSDQGQVLVPGLTIGMLGQDFIAADGSSGAANPLDATFATLLEQHFKSSGIMHLMAVSGGHFALVLGMVRRLCATVLLPRWCTAIVTAVTYGALASVVYPSDSVLRALVMGLFSAAATGVGRRSQALNALAWTAIAVLLMDPDMSRSFGFALSCAAVLGIVLWSGPISDLLRHIMPSVLADGIALTLAAQLLTLPIQVLMSPELPVLSVPANLMVAPFVDFSTLTGLAALMVSVLCKPLGFALAWLSSCGTAVMQWAADAIGSSPAAVIPWSGGWNGAVLVLTCEALVALVWWDCGRLVALLGERSNGGTVGSSFRNGPRQRLGVWLAHTRRMAESLEWGP